MMAKFIFLVNYLTDFHKVDGISMNFIRASYEKI